MFSARDNFQNLKNIEIQINSIFFNNSGKQSYIIEGKWNLEHDIIEKFNNRVSTIYYMEENKYAKQARVVLSDTSITFEIEFNINLENSDIIETHLFNEDNKFNWIESNFDDINNNLKVTFDLGKYSNNINELVLKVPRKNKEDIIIKFRRDS